MALVRGQTYLIKTDTGLADTALNLLQYPNTVDWHLQKDNRAVIQQVTETSESFNTKDVVAVSYTHLTLPTILLV